MFKYEEEKNFTKDSCHGQILAHIDRGSKILEFGCATGVFSRHLKEEYSCHVTGIELNSTAATEAKKVLDRVIVADLNCGEWYGELEGEKFDCIIFADVLEHLTDPQKVLSKAKELLFENGKLLFSIPNVAHIDILAKLINDRFDYTDTGLLDSTHIHLFAKENVIELVNQSGFFLTELSATYSGRGYTEQAFSRTFDPSLDFLLNQKTSLAYQYVGAAYREEYAKANSLVFDDKVLSPIILPYSTVTFRNKDEKFDQAGMLKIPFKSAYSIEFETDLPKDARMLRIGLADPGVCRIVNNLEFYFDGKQITTNSFHGMKKIQNIYVIGSDTAFFDIFIPFESEKFKCVASLYPIFSQANPTEIFCGFEREFEEYEKKLKDTYALMEKKEEEHKKQINEYSYHFNLASEQRDGLFLEKGKLQERIYELEARLKNVSDTLDGVANSACWKITKPIRVMLDFIKKIPLVRKTYRGFKCLRENGLKYTIRRIKQKIRNKKIAKRKQKIVYNEQEIKRQEEFVFDKDIKFSVIVPLYNTKDTFLIPMIESVINQTYKNWELCLADGSDEDNTSVYETVSKFAQKDSRILYKRLEKNMGISGNTNEALKMATGDYIVLFDHDDLLHKSALFKVMEVICRDGADFIYTDENTFAKTPDDAYYPHHKPDFSPDTLRSYNYICHLCVFSRGLFEKVGGFRSEFDGSQDYDMILRLTEKAEKIVHIPEILYFWRSHPNSVASDISAKPYTIVAAKKALSEHLQRVGLEGEVTDSVIPSTYRIKYKIKGEPKVSIIIPTKDHTDDLDTCIKSIQKLTTYKNYEIIIVENNSTLSETFEYYNNLEKEYSNIKTVTYKGGFNYSKINNFGRRAADGEYLILLNNDIEILTPGWIEEMLMFVQRDDVGACGMMLYYPDDTVQHAGVIIGIGGVAGHSHKYFKKGDYGYASRLTIAQNLSACTAAALMVKASVYDEVGGLDESFAVAFNDVDFCLKIRRAGYLILFTPYAEAYHHESKSRGLEDTVEKQRRFKGEIDNFYGKWQDFLDKGDPYYNKNLTLEREDFSLKE